MREREILTPESGSVKRALAILEHLDGARRGLNISELSRSLRIPKSSAHVLMLTLERLGYVERRLESNYYSLGLKAHMLGHGLLSALHVAETARPLMNQLANALHLCAHLAVQDHQQGVLIQKVEPPGAARFDTYVGRRFGLHSTASGKVILAFGPAEGRECILAKPAYSRHTVNTISSPAALARELDIVLRSGFAVNDEEEELGVCCVAVPVLDGAGRFIAALSATGLASQVSLAEAAETARPLKEAARAIAKVRHPADNGNP